MTRESLLLNKKVGCSSVKLMYTREGDPIAYRLKLLKPDAKKFRTSLTLLDQKSRAKQL